MTKTTAERRPPGGWEIQTFIIDGMDVTQDTETTAQAVRLAKKVAKSLGHTVRLVKTLGRDVQP